MLLLLLLLRLGERIKKQGKQLCHHDDDNTPHITHTLAYQLLNHIQHMLNPRVQESTARQQL